MLLPTLPADTAMEVVKYHTSIPQDTSAAMIKRAYRFVI